MMAESGCRDRSHLTLDLKGLKPTPNNDSGLSPIFTAMPLSPEKIQFGTQQQQQIQAHQPQQHHQILETPTPSNFFTKNPTSAQESFAEGFIEVFKKVQGSHATPINNSPSALKFLHTLFGHLSPNGTTKTFLGQEQQQPGIVSRLSPGTVAKDFLTQQQQPIQQLPSPSGTANQQFLPGTDSSCALRLDVPQIVLTNTNNSNNNCGVNSDLISAAVAAAAAAATTAQQSQQSPQQQLNSPLSVGSTTAVVTGSAAGEDSSSPYSTAASSVNSVVDIGATTANTYMDYHLANLGQLSPAVTSAAGNNIAAGGVDFFQPQLAQFNSSAAIGLMAQQHQPKDIKREQQQPSNNAAVGIDHVILKQHAAAATQLNGMPLVGMRGKLSSAARTNVLHSLQTHISAHHHHHNHHHNAKIDSYGGGRQNLKGADIGDQDMKKLERKRARNRLAASKCRQRKLQRITDLEQQVNEERERGSELQMQINQLQNVIRELEGRLKANEHHQQQHMSIITHRQNS